MADVLLINRKKFTSKCGKAFTKIYAQKTILMHFIRFYRNINKAIKIATLVIKSFYNDHVKKIFMQ